MSIYQTFPDTCERPTLLPAQKQPTNPRYADTFKQIYFTAGDEEQFDLHKNSVSFGLGNIPSLENPVWNIAFDPLYREPEDSAVLDTFRYMFHKFKKGIFIQIRNRELARFLPFSNAHFVNEWSHLVPTPPELKGQKNVLPAHLWYANNYLVRYENPPVENDTGFAQIKNMFEELCTIYEVPDVEFFVNRRDFPLLKKDRTEPYDAIFGSNHALVSHQYETYLPILSMVEHPEFADVAIPTPDDWARTSAMKKVPSYFMGSKRSLEPFKDNFYRNWAEKHPRAVFRGSTTGKGIGENNLRVRLWKLTQTDARFDVGITDQSARYQIHGGELVTPPIIPKHQLKGRLDSRAQSQYKYVIHVPGHVQAYRLSVEMAMESVILLVGDEGDYKLWFEKKMVAWVHFVPVKRDLSDLFERMDWCKENDGKCQKIARASREFYDKHLSRYGCLNYLYELVCTYRSTCLPHMPIYPSLPATDIQNLQKLGMLATLPKARAFRISTAILSERRCYLRILADHARADPESEVLFSNKKSRLILTSKKCARKTSLDGLAHEALIGLACVNDLVHELPNFRYTFGYNERTRALDMEYIEGKTMSDYIQSPEFIFVDWICMMKQLALAFSVAQKRCYFVHHDACPWNIVLNEQPYEVFQDYAISPARIIRVKTRRVPVLIDYGMARAVSDGGVIQNRGGFETFKDSLCLLVSSAHAVVRYQHLNGQYQQILLDIFNTALSGYEGYYARCHNFRDLVAFLARAHKFASITFAPKGPILSKTPMDLYDALNIKSNYWTFEEVNEVVHTHVGKVASIYDFPRADEALFERYAFQQLWLMTARGPTEHFLVQNFRARELKCDGFFVKQLILTEDRRIDHPRYPYIKVASMLSRMLTCGGPFSLNSTEKQEVARLIELCNKID